MKSGRCIRVPKEQGGILTPQGTLKGTWWRHQMKTLPRCWPFVRGIHQSPVYSSHKDQWRGALMFSLICDWINSWVNNREAGDLRRRRAHYDVIVMNSGNISRCLAKNGLFGQACCQHETTLCYVHVCHLIHVITIMKSNALVDVWLPHLHKVPGSLCLD